MSDGIYILKTKDGCRATYSKRYDDFVTYDADINFTLNGKAVQECFGNCTRYDTMAKVMDEARRLSRKYHETDDGICVIDFCENLLFDDIVRD
jgi:hypothetical protein